MLLYSQNTCHRLGGRMGVLIDRSPQGCKPYGHTKIFLWSGLTGSVVNTCQVMSIKFSFLAFSHWILETNSFNMIRTVI